jgi:hypothetical protein
VHKMHPTALVVGCLPGQKDGASHAPYGLHVEQITWICDPGVPALAGEYLPGQQNGALHAPYGYGSGYGA